MSTRSTRRPSPPNNTESLLLAQAVWDLGANQSTWPTIAKLLSKHPLLSRPKSFFTPQSCHSMYEILMKDAGLEMNESTSVPRASLNLQLAQKHYRSRLLELQGLILNEETKFKAVLKEIENIRSGLLEKQDPNTKARAQSPIQLPLEPSPQNQIADEIFNGSDLSGGTESVESNPSQSQPEHESHGLDSKIDDNTEHDDEEMEDTIPSAGKPANLEQPALGNELSPSTPKGQMTDLLDQVTETIPTTPRSEQAFFGIEPSNTSLKSEDQLPMDNSAEMCLAFDMICKNDKMEGVEAREASMAIEDEDISSHAEPLDKRQEEEEEEITQEEKNEEEEEEEEEEEAVEGRDDQQTLDAVEYKQNHEEDERKDLLTDGGQETKDFPEGHVNADTEQNTEEEPVSPKSIQDNKMESDLEPEPVRTPVAETIGSEVEPTPEDEQSSEMEEPVAPARRSSRRRKSSAASVLPVQARTRLRSKAHVNETGLLTTTAIDSDNEGDLDAQDDAPQIGEERASSPYDGAITRRRDGKRKSSFLESAGSPQDKKRLREDSEPVDEEEPGPSSHNLRARIARHGTRTEEQVAMKRFQSVIGMLHSQISQHRNGNIFHNPIKNSEAPDYHEIVKRPMDLKTIKTRVKDGVIASSLEFQRDIYLMFANAMMYNRPGSDVHAMAEDMMLESEGQINAFRQTEGLVKRGQRP